MIQPLNARNIIAINKHISRSFRAAFLFAGILIVMSGSLRAQEPEKILAQDATQTFDLNKDLYLQLPPLDSLIIIAVQNHPTVNLNQELIGSADQRLKIAQKTWTNMLSGFMNYGYGNQTLVATGSSNTDILNIANGYRVGFNLNVPLNEFATRKNRITLARHEIEATRYKTEEMSLVISEQVIEEYHYLLSNQKMMQIRFSMKEAARTNTIIAEQDYKSGNIDVTSFTRMMEISTIAQSEYEVARRNFRMSYDKMCILLGTPLHLLYRKAE
jgi:outer membrane protein TolC